MTNKEIELYKKNVQKILSEEGNNLESLEKTYSNLQSIAEKVGASKHLGIVTLNSLSAFTKSEDMSEPLVRCDGMKARITEVVYSIHDALRTETMLNACKAANKSAVTAIMSAVIAIISTLIALAAVVLN